MNTGRTLEGWIQESHRLPRITEFFLITPNFQSIGVLDLKLSTEWIEIRDTLTEESNLARFSQHSFLSSLWIMGAYEILRVLKNIAPGEEINRVYELFRRVRVPMVKFEVPKTRGIADYPDDLGIAYGAISGQGENKLLGWAVSSNVFISREDLANELYNLY